MDLPRYQLGEALQVAYVYTLGGEAMAGQLSETLASWGYNSLGLHQLGTVQAAVVGPGAFGIAAEPMAQHSRHRARDMFDFLQS